MLQKLTLLACISIISGCSDSNIDLVKNSTNPYWEGYTASQLLDNRGQCEKIDWKSFNDKNKRVIVEYNCKLTPATEIVKERIITSRPDDKDEKEILRAQKFWANDVSERINERIEEYQEYMQKEIGNPENNLKQIEFLKIELKERIENINKQYEGSMRKHKISQAFSDLTAEKFDGVYESHQWVIRNDSPSFQGSFMVFKLKDEEDYSLPHDPELAYKTAIEDSDKANAFLELVTSRNWQQINQRRHLEYEKQQP